MKTLILLGLLVGSSAASAATVTVQSTDSVYNFNGSATAGSSSTTPQIVSLASGTLSLTFSATGSVLLTPGPYPYGSYGPDGGPSVFSMNVLSANNLSGVKSPNVGYLAGVFLNGSEGLAPAPATLDYSSSGTGEGFASLSPLVDQVFFIGDGLTGTGTGAVQQFFVPSGAKSLVLGIVDANDYGGPPGAYSDNTGSYQVTITPTLNAVASAAPEPATWAMMILGFGTVGFAMRRAARRSEEKFSAKIKRIAEGDVIPT